MSIDIYVSQCTSPCAHFYRECMCKKHWSNRVYEMSSLLTGHPSLFLKMTIPTDTPSQKHCNSLYFIGLSTYVSNFLISVILVNVRQYHVVLLICICWSAMKLSTLFSAIWHLCCEKPVHISYSYFYFCFSSFPCLFLDIIYILIKTLSQFCFWQIQYPVLLFDFHSLTGTLILR